MRSLDLTGMLLPRHEDGQPYFMELPSDPGDIFLPVFSTFEAMVKGMWHICPDKAPNPGKIDDGFEFLGSIPEKLSNGTRIRVIVDIRLELTEDGKPFSRFTEIPRGDSPLLAQLSKL